MIRPLPAVLCTAAYLFISDSCTLAAGLLTLVPWIRQDDRLCMACHLKILWSKAWEWHRKIRGKEDFAMKKMLNRLRDRCSPAVHCFIEDEEGVGVVEIILILVENSTTQNPCVLC